MNGRMEGMKRRREKNKKMRDEWGKIGKGGKGEKISGKR